MNDVSTEVKDLPNLLERIDIIEDRYSDLINKYEKEEVKLQDITEELISKGYVVKNKNEFIIFESFYYKRFFNLLMKVARPVVGIYYKEAHKIQILGIAHINKYPTEAH
ncbi:hypothetical protein [Bacillus sp. (in: firmicutes)]|uniref:hypothetical protein n=1 Tax=Bacillus sp. TaxID=1409 RepID=UPI000EBCAEB0|nr:hypothetical protein [Bacillus sp. (in: firmicutes)]HCO78336.1 hypothetical protein [Bacillus sp. (in: firmicutes)]